MIVGAMKAGTTSLHNYLGFHPEVFTSSPKEIHFLDEKPYDYSHFISDKKIVGVTPQNYTKLHLSKYQNIPQLLKREIPKVKIVYLVRNPIKRILSHYREQQKHGKEPRNGLNNFLLEENNHYLMTSMYFFQISKYLEYFPQDQIEIVLFEDLVNNRLDTLNSIFRFLGVSELKDELMFNFKSNESSLDSRKVDVRRFFPEVIKKFYKKTFPDELRDFINKSFLNDLLLYRTDYKSEIISEETLSKIKPLLYKDVDDLSKLVGQDLIKFWNLK
ncbi:sulfotransferase [Mangrovivirga sp. M17]|uniref:Sulfotransferase n=1 Tax=Mangrovivirga halotolerans TaxID=2993936 RepID=A0ABT3RPY1_9BACT|nr:sulfotransferase [Mangrovivirga halotolerans]MCX2743398.1 sulfotransferase [Mangrovivirga halotolerans]